MGQGLVSVVITTYNYERFVTGAVESALAQTYPDREVIVVDDGSTDSTRDRLAPYEGRIRYIHQENSGPSAARNTGIRAAQGDLIAFLDSDDLWHPDKLAVQVRHLEAHPELAVLAAERRVLDGSDAGQVDWPRLDAAQPIGARAVSFDELVIASRFGVCGVVARRWCFDEVGLFDESLRGAEDQHMWIRIASRFPIAILDVPLWLYRFHDTNSHRLAARMEANTLNMLGKVFDGPAPLSRSSSLKRKALANDFIDFAYGYRDSHAYGAALLRIARSFLLWPFPNPYMKMNIKHLHPLARLKFLAVVLAQATRWHLGLDRPIRLGAHDTGVLPMGGDGTRGVAIDVEL